MDSGDFDLLFILFLHIWFNFKSIKNVWILGGFPKFFLRLYKGFDVGGIFYNFRGRIFRAARPKPIVDSDRGDDSEHIDINVTGVN